MPYLSSASKVRRCISWHAADASINGPCRAGSTPPSSARTWNKPRGTGAARTSYAREVAHAHGLRRFELECSGWHASWRTKDVTAPWTAALVQPAFVDATLAAPEGGPSPGSAAE
ncbi:hypothetical protein AB0D47_39740 [Streptomyces sp. NPDC048376]|uniref:hypothetical protein n=1 Tax=unclassified Streptomyces TaxID=2593676 RepID=UPI003425AF6B